MDGYAFCVGLTSLKALYQNRADLVGLIRSSTFLIRRAIPRNHTSQRGSFSLRVQRLGELVDMYHSRETTDLRDKVYALLGMSSDRQNFAQLSPNYTVARKDVLTRLLSSLVGDEVAVDTWDDEEVAVIRGSGAIIGQVSAIAGDRANEDRQVVDVLLRVTPRSERIKAQWTLQPFAKAIERDDLICILQGSNTPAHCSAT